MNWILYVEGELLDGDVLNHGEELYSPAVFTDEHIDRNTGIRLEFPTRGVWVREDAREGQLDSTLRGVKENG